ncbi:MAG: hypothetical protein BWX87_00673 [Bacteroidetes bacterium ADurb.Bin123]|nr:MAG: hypothetical protein BWX87_00673 [Bacteroidetes bacterium ADurb.Bin123]
MKLRRPITSTDLYRKRFNVLDFKDEWLQLIGRPEVTGSWIIYGDSAHGKTRFMIQMAKYLGQFGRVFINSLEEGEAESIRQVWQQEDIDTSRDHVYLLDKEPVNMVRQRLEARNAPDIVFFDSVQFMRKFSEDDYVDLLNDFGNKLFIFTSHAEGKKAKGAVAEAIRYRSFVKIMVEGYRAFSKSRYGGSGYYDVWPEMAEKYWAERLKSSK